MPFDACAFGCGLNNQTSHAWPREEYQRSHPLMARLLSRLDPGMPQEMVAGCLALMLTMQAVMAAGFPCHRGTGCGNCGISQMR